MTEAGVGCGLTHPAAGWLAGRWRRDAEDAGGNSRAEGVSCREPEPRTESDHLPSRFAAACWARLGAWSRWVVVRPPALARVSRPPAPRGRLAWAALARSVLWASVAANVAVGGHDPLGKALVGWAALSLLVTLKLLFSMLEHTVPPRTLRPRAAFRTPIALSQ